MTAVSEADLIGLLNDTNLSQIDSAILAQDYRAFVKYGWNKMQGKNKPLKWNWHMDCLADHLQAKANGDTRHSMFIVPPRHTKSTMLSHFFHPWMWLRWPNLEFISAAYKQGRADKDNNMSLAIIQSQWYQDLVANMPGDLQWKLTSKATARIINNKSGQRLAIGMGGISGENADYVLIDDCLSSTDAYSDTALIKLENWWRETITTRFNDPEKGIYCVIGQRLAEKDIMGLVMASEDLSEWNRVVLPTEYVPNHPTPFFSNVINPDTGDYWVDKRTKEGELLFPDHYTKKAVGVIKRRMSKRAYESQHLGIARPEEGGTFKKEWFQMIGKDIYADLEKQYVVQSWDTALTEQKLMETEKGLEPADSVCTTWVIVHRKDYPENKFMLLVDLWGDKVGMPKLRRKAIELHDKWRPDIVLIEDQINGRSLIQEMEALDIGVYAFNPKQYGGKRMRAVTAAAVVEDRRILIPNWKTELSKLVDFMVAWPNAGKDTTDSASQAILFMRNHGVIVEGDVKEDFDAWDSPYMEIDESDSNPYIIT